MYKYSRKQERQLFRLIILKITPSRNWAKSVQQNIGYWPIERRKQTLKSSMYQFAISLANAIHCRKPSYLTLSNEIAFIKLVSNK